MHIVFFFTYKLCTLYSVYIVYSVLVFTMAVLRQLLHVGILYMHGPWAHFHNVRLKLDVKKVNVPPPHYTEQPAYYATHTHLPIYLTQILWGHILEVYSMIWLQQFPISVGCFQNNFVQPQIFFMIRFAIIILVKIQNNSIEAEII